MSKEKKSPPKVAYAAWLNLAGLSGVTKVFLDPNWEVYHDEPRWWSRNGNMGVEKMGHYRRSGYSYFASENKREVELWVMGIENCMKFLRDWAHE